MTALTVLLLAVASALLCGLFASLSVLTTLKGSLFRDLAIEIELATPADSARAALVAELRARPDVLSVESLSANEVLSEMELELGESLRGILTENPFPPIVRVKLRDPRPELIEAFITDAAQRQQVLQVVYPRDLAARLDHWTVTLRGRAGYLAVLFAVAGWMLAGLALRAIIRSRWSSSELLVLLGLRPRDLKLAHLLASVILGLLAGLFAVLFVHSALRLVGWMLLTELPTPAGLFGWSCAVSVGLAVLASLWAPRTSKLP